MRILLLGSTGLLGNNVWRLLTMRGHEAVLLVRDKGRMDWTGLDDGQRERTSIVEGSMLNATTLRKAAQGCEAIVNCAGCTDMSLLRYEDYLPANRDLCRLLAEEMESMGICRLVHVSTANTIGYGTPKETANEDAPMAEPFAGSFYASSKKEGETVLLDYAARHPEGHVIVVCPGFMVGGHDAKPSSGKLLLAAHGKPLMACTKGGKSFVPVKDAAAAVANAIVRGDNGRRYLLTGENLSLKAFYELESRTMGYRQWLVCLPDWLALAAAKAGDLLRRMGIRTQLCTSNVRQLLIREYYDNRRAVRDLGMPQTSLGDAIRDFFAGRE